MRKILYSFLFCFLLSGILLAQTTRIIAHRGYWKTDGSAQNSIAALKKADDIKVYGSEFDVLLTSDNILVVNHDNSIFGVPIQTTPYAGFEKLRLLNGEKLPTLDEYLEAGKNLDTKLIFELKPHDTPERNREAARLSVAAVEKLGLADRTEYITFNLDAGKELIRLTKVSPVSYLNGELSPAELKELGFAGLDYHYRVLKNNPEWIKEAHDLGLIVNVWTVNDPEMIADFAKQGVDFITTDIPEEALQIVLDTVK